MNFAANAVWTLLTLGQNAGDPSSTESTLSAAEVQSVWDFMIKGGPMMVPIVLCSLVALAVFVERLLSLRRSKVIPPSFLRGLGDVLNDDSENRKIAIGYCQENGSPLARIFMAGIKKLGEPVEQLEKHIQEAGEREVLKLRKFLRSLSVIASISPLMGLLGTIFGMITAFQTVATSGEALGKAELLAKGIYEAMITTAAGLMVTIPVLIGYHWLSAKIESLVGEMDQMTFDFVEAYGQSTVSLETRGGGLATSSDTPVSSEPEETRTDAGALAVEPVASAS